MCTTQIQRVLLAVTTTEPVYCCSFHPRSFCAIFGQTATAAKARQGRLFHSFASKIYKKLSILITHVDILSCRSTLKRAVACRLDWRIWRYQFPRQNSKHRSRNDGIRNDVKGSQVSISYAKTTATKNRARPVTDTLGGCTCSSCIFRTRRHYWRATNCCGASRTKFEQQARLDKAR